MSALAAARAHVERALGRTVVLGHQEVDGPDGHFHLWTISQARDAFSLDVLGDGITIEAAIEAARRR